MPPPISYIDITSVPFSRVVTQAEFNGGTFGGVANAVWFRFDTLVDIIFGGVTNRGGTFIPRMRVYASDGSTVLLTAFDFESWHFHVAAGTYYVEVIKFSGGTSNFDFTCNFDTRPVLLPADIQGGDYFINDDLIPVGGALTAVMTPSGDMRGYLVNHFPSGECGAMLPTGESLWFDALGIHGSFNSIALFNASYEYVMSFEFPDLFGGTNPRITEDGTQFYLLTISAKQVWTISKTGVVSAAPIATVPLVTNTLPGRTAGIGVSQDGTTLYYAFLSGATSGVILRWDLVNNLALSDLYVIPGWNFSPATDHLALTADINWAEILTMADGRVITNYYDVSSSTSHILILSNAGILLHDFAYSTVNYTIDHLAYLWGDEDHILAWFHDNGNVIGRWAVVSLTDGTLTNEFQFDMFEHPFNIHNNSFDIWGPSESCVVFVAIPEDVPAPPIGSIGCPHDDFPIGLSSNRACALDNFGVN